MSKAIKAANARRTPAERAATAQKRAATRKAHGVRHPVQHIKRPHRTGVHRTQVHRKVGRKKGHRTRRRH